MKKIIMHFAVASFVLGMTSCGGGYGDEAKAVAEGVCECADEDKSMANIKSCFMSEMLKSDKMKEFATSDDPKKQVKNLEKKFNML